MQIHTQAAPGGASGGASVALACFERQGFRPLKLVSSFLFGDERIISYKLNVYIIADHWLFMDSCVPQKTLEYPLSINAKE